MMTGVLKVIHEGWGVKRWCYIGMHSATSLKDARIDQLTSGQKLECPASIDGKSCRSGAKSGISLRSNMLTSRERESIERVN